MHDDIITQEEPRRFHVNREGAMKSIQLRCSFCGEGVDGIAIVYIHNQVKTSAISQELVKVAGVVL